jgi:CxxC motif-containing protein (DUF1111 family)
VSRSAAVAGAFTAAAGAAAIAHLAIPTQAAATPDPAERLAAILKPTSDFTKAEAYEANPAGAATSRDPINISAFSHASANMSFERQLQFKVGDGIFRKLWISAPSSTQSSDGLGPLFNARSCQSCHLKDGRGRPPAPGEAAVSMVLRLGIPPRSDEDRQALADHRRAVIPEPTYGGQLQTFAIQGLKPEGQMTIRYDEVPVHLAGGETVTLRKPTYGVADLGYGPMQPDVMLSPRVAPPMIGLGFLELIPARDILANADPDDRDGDGISGRPNRVWSEADGKPTLGRFGWKAGEPSIRQQTGHAAGGDIGLSSALAPNPSGDCTDRQPACMKAPNGNDADEQAELTEQMLELVTLYARNLAVPARRDVGKPQVLAGKKLFYDSGCTACHRPKYVTPKSDEMPEQSAQLIWPYTDLLLHDMGEGLADNRPESDATGREWRTPPLWGIGLTGVVSGHTHLLHDGRARNLLEAILWHGGEAEAAKQRVTAMTPEQRAALIAFLNSL